MTKLDPAQTAVTLAVLERAQRPTDSDADRPRRTRFAMTIVILLVFFCTPGVVFTQIPAASPSGTPTGLAKIASDQTQVAVLSAQLETMRQYDQRLLSTVYYALGALGGVILAGYEVPHLLDEMRRILGKKKALMRASTIADMNRALDKVPKEYSETVEQIRQAIASLAEPRKSERS